LDTPNSYEDQKDKIVIVNAAEDGIEFKERIYVFDQGTPSTTWNITHTLDKYPSVTIINSAGYIIEGSIQYISKTNIIVSFNSAFSGTAILN
jgi:hypothetical protein